MTDLQAFIDLYKRLGIDCQVNKYEFEQVIYLAKAEDLNFLSLDGVVTFSNKFNGYSEFHSKIVFDLEGKFIEQGFWE